MMIDQRLGEHCIGLMMTDESRSSESESRPLSPLTTMRISDYLVIVNAEF